MFNTCLTREHPKEMLYLTFFFKITKKKVQILVNCLQIKIVDLSYRQVHELQFYFQPSELLSLILKVLIVTINLIVLNSRQNLITNPDNLSFN